MYETMIAFPGIATSLLVGKRLVNSDHNVSLFCPNPVYQRMAGSVPSDLKIAALDTGSTVKVVDDLSSMKVMDFIIFPSIDFLPENSRSEFGSSCQTYFR